MCLNQTQKSAFGKKNILLRKNECRIIYVRREQNRQLFAPHAVGTQAWFGVLSERKKVGRRTISGRWEDANGCMARPTKKKVCRLPRAMTQGGTGGRREGDRDFLCFSTAAVGSLCLEINFAVLHSLLLMQHRQWLYPTTSGE